jgi:hypothetical protein
MCFTDKNVAGRNVVGTEPAPRLHTMSSHEDPALAPFGLSRSNDKHVAGRDIADKTAAPDYHSINHAIAKDSAGSKTPGKDPAAELRGIDIAIDRSMDALALIQKPTGGSKVYETQRSAARRGKCVSDI